MAGVGGARERVSMSRVYPPDLASLAASRVQVRDFLADARAAELSAVATVLVGELVSNVVRHARSPVHLDLALDDTALRIEVRDGSSIRPAISDIANSDGGYGLQILDALADDWGLRLLADGKAIWCVVSRDRDGKAL